MLQKNYTDHFNGYMKKHVLRPTPEMRALIFALRSINENLDNLFLKTYAREIPDLEVIELQIKNLRSLRGLIETELSDIFDELDYNRRQHYSAVLEHFLGHPGALLILLCVVCHKEKSASQDHSRGYICPIDTVGP